jgi:L-glutamine-phosphate cytidylyltransferase
MPALMIDTAIILAAGQGSRLLPLTADRPKCLIDFSGKTLLAWQVEALFANGVKKLMIVTGYRTDMVEEELARLARPGLEIEVCFNPFHKVADNLASCWLARAAMERDFLILNGDTLVSNALVARVQQPSDWPIAVTVDVKPSYDSDDMKVERQGDLLLAIGKTLTAAQSNAESIGFLAFRGEGAALFRDTVDSYMRTPAGLENWYLKIIDALAPTGKIGTVSIEGHEWGEVDFLNDIEVATKLTDGWRDQAGK